MKSEEVYAESEVLREEDDNDDDDDSDDLVAASWCCRCFRRRFEDEAPPAEEHVFPMGALMMGALVLGCFEDLLKEEQLFVFLMVVWLALRTFFSSVLPW